MIPSKIPTLLSKDFLEPPADEFQVGEQRSTIGWLMHFFLLREEDGCLVYNDVDKRDYARAESEFKRVNGLHKHDSLLEWEDEESLTVQKKAWNKFAQQYKGKL